MKKVIVICCLLVLASGSAFGWGVPKLGGDSKSSAPAVSMEDAAKVQGDLVTAYANGVKLNLSAQGIMADALGLKEEAALLTTTADGIKEGNTKDLVSSASSTQGAKDAVDAKMKAGGELSADAKKKVAKSLVPLGLSLVSYKTAVDKSKSALEMAKSVIENAPMTEKLSAKEKLDPVLTIAPQVPKDLAAVAGTAKQFLAFAKSAGIAPPADLTKALGDL